MAILLYLDYDPAHIIPHMKKKNPAKSMAAAEQCSVPKIEVLVKNLIL
jgi:hypothetical protein